MTTNTDARPALLSARALAARIAQGRLTAEALAEDCLAMAAEREPVVRAFSHLDREAFLAEARARDAAPPAGPLHGVPFAIKDVIDCTPLPSGCGSPIYRDYFPVADAGAVAMARRAGGVAMGKTVTAEFATSHPGPTTNPHDPAHTPGGSSSGSAAAVAAFMVPLALGTQTGGSMIRPASFCGVVGYKPSFGTVNRCGVKQVSDSLDTVGVFARSVDDAALALAAITGRADLDRAAPAAPARIGIYLGHDWSAADADAQAALEAAVTALARAGVALREIAPPPELETFAHAHHTIEYFELARALQHEYRHHREQLTPGLARRVETGLACAGEDYAAALAQARRGRAAVAPWFEDLDLVLTPAAPGEAPSGLGSTGNSAFNRNWTLLRLPCLTLPSHRGAHGLPVGVQFVGPRGADARVLAQGAWLEALLCARAG
jgi:amidase